MAYATIRYGDESQYADLQRDFQRMMAQLGARRDEAARHDSDQWFRAVTGGIGSIADSAERGIVANYNRRNQLADQTSQREFATQQMRDQAALREGYGSWGDVESAAGDRGISTPELFDARDEARARAGDSRRLAFERARDADIVGRNLAQDRQMFEQDIRQAEQSAAVQNMMQPFVVSPEDEQIINTRLPTPFRDMYNKARDQERMLLSDRTLSTENRISGLAKVRDQMRNVVLHAKNAKPNPVEELQQNVQQDPRSGMWFSKGKGGEWSAIKTPEADMDADFDKQIKSILFNPQLPPEAKNAAMQNIIGARKMVNDARYQSNLVTRPDGIIIEIDPKTGIESANSARNREAKQTDAVKLFGEKLDAMKGAQTDEGLKKEVSPATMTALWEESVRQAGAVKTQMPASASQPAAPAPSTPGKKRTPAELLGGKVPASQWTAEEWQEMLKYAGKK